jgi:predicted nucleotide-binding protein (sugar kinase/HSP70/actin superfamily)
MSETTNGARRTVFIPNMADHARALAAAMRFHGTDAEALPPPSEASLTTGIRECVGRECMPCFLCVGDFLRKAQEPGFDPARAIFFLPTTSGPCRFGQYTALLRDVLDRHGCGEVEIMSPSGKVGYNNLGENPTGMRKLAWQATVAVDLLYRLLHEYRPYELQKGATDAAYAECLDRIVAATDAGGGRALEEAMEWVADRFRALPVNRDEQRPVVAVLGEIYVRWNAFSNRDLFREVEALGGEVLVSSMGEMMYYTNYRVVSAALASGNYRQIVSPVVTDLYQAWREHRLHHIVAPLLRRPDEQPIYKLIRAIRPYYDARLGTEAVLSIGRAIEYARAGIDGILNVLPFSCMPGVIVTGIAPRLRKDLDYIPWLDIPYDAQKATNIRTRLEAFMHQVQQFQRREAPSAGGGAARPRKRTARSEAAEEAMPGAAG